jgi:hypothetical protein
MQVVANWNISGGKVDESQRSAIQPERASETFGQNASNADAAIAT